jgi:CheY-like chemotaxis protein
MGALFGVRVLVADDDVDNAEMLAELLTLRGADVHTAANGFEVLELVSRSPPDALLLDIEMPDIDGYELARLLRKAPATSAMPILAVTARVSKTDMHEAFEAGFDAHVPKPIDGDALITLLAAMVGKAA